MSAFVVVVLVCIIPGVSNNEFCSFDDDGRRKSWRLAIMGSGVRSGWAL